MAKFSKRLLDQLSEFVVCEIASKVLDGITYTMVLKDKKDDMSDYERYMSIKEEVSKCGYTTDEVFRVYEVNNGYIFDMDIQTAKVIATELTKAVIEANGEQVPTGDIILSTPDKRRKRDMVELAKYVTQQYQSGKNQVEIALFNRNSTNKIIISGRGQKNERLAVKYNAYAIRHWDIQLINEKILIPSGIRISRIQPCEILPSKTGVSFILTIEEM